MRCSVVRKGKGQVSQPYGKQSYDKYETIPHCTGSMYTTNEFAVVDSDIHVA